MPVDLSAAGLPSRYSPRKPRFLPWLIVWLLCSVIGAGLTLLLWRSKTPAEGPWFWFCVLILPTLIFCIVLGVALTHSEALYAQVAHRNRHRDAWLTRRIRFAQQPLQVLGTGYCLPFEVPRLCEALTGTASLMRTQAPRIGAHWVMHGRFADDDLRLRAWAEGGDEFKNSPIPDTNDRTCDARVVALFEVALAPLVSTLHALSQQGKANAPVVCVAAEALVSTARRQEACVALQRAGLPTLECLVIPDSHGLMIIDVWLDSGDRRPRLLLAAAWRDAPSYGSTEGAVAVLLAPMHTRLPESVQPVGIVHRPVDGPVEVLGDVLAQTVLWGRTEAFAVAQAWITGWKSDDDSKLQAALQHAAPTVASQDNAQCRIDPLIGDAGAARPWLSLAAAIESRVAGPQLLLDADRTVHAALLYVKQTVPDDTAHD